MYIIGGSSDLTGTPFYECVSRCELSSKKVKYIHPYQGLGYFNKVCVCKCVY